MGGDVELARRLAARRVDRGERVVGRDPDMGAVIGDPVDASDAGKRAIFAKDGRWRSFHARSFTPKHCHGRP